MSQATALLGLITETSLHAGAGSSVGVVDLPIQREGHNGWPCVFGSAVKGALRDMAEGLLCSEQTDPKDGKVGMVGYEINFNRYFYRYAPPRPLEEIEADIRGIESDILRLLGEVTGSTGE